MIQCDTCQFWLHARCDAPSHSAAHDAHGTAYWLPPRFPHLPICEGRSRRATAQVRWPRRREARRVRDGRLCVHVPKLPRRAHHHALPPGTSTWQSLLLWCTRAQTSSTRRTPVHVAASLLWWRLVLLCDVRPRGTDGARPRGRCSSSWSARTATASSWSPSPSSAPRRISRRDLGVISA